MDLRILILDELIVTVMKFSFSAITTPLKRLPLLRIIICSILRGIAAAAAAGGAAGCDGCGEGANEGGAGAGVGAAG
jgi:hypothetical protein